jgi:replicative DNA helicase
MTNGLQRKDAQVVDAREMQLETLFMGTIVKDLNLLIEVQGSGIGKTELYADHNKAVWELALHYSKEGLKQLTPSIFTDKFGTNGQALYDEYIKANSHDFMRYMYEMRKRKTKRELQSTLTDLQDKLTKSTSMQEMEKVKQNMFDAVMLFENSEKRSYTVNEIIEEHFVYKGHMAPVKTGYDIIDENIGKGLYRGFFTVLAGESGNFKTTLTENMIINMILKYDYNVYFQTMEMTKDKIVENFLAKLTDSDIEAWRVFFFKEDEVATKKELAKRVMRKVHEHIEINDHSFTPKEMAREIIRASKRNFDIFVIDYFQHLVLEDGQEFNDASKVLCEAIKRCPNMACLLLSQVTNPGKGKDKDPKEASLRFAKNLVNDTSLEMIVFRDPKEEGVEPETEFLNVFLRKNRNGKADTLTRLLCIPSKGIIGEFDYQEAIEIDAKTREPYEDGVHVAEEIYDFVDEIQEKQKNRIVQTNFFE